jgi:hypothetical protein
MESKRKPIVVAKVESDRSEGGDSESEESVKHSSSSHDRRGISIKSKAIKKKVKGGGVSFDDSEDSEEAEERKHREPLKNIYKEKRRGFTISIVVPSSIIDNA